MNTDKRITEVVQNIELVRTTLEANESIKELITQIAKTYLNGGIILERFVIKNCEHIQRNPVSCNQLIWSVLTHNSIYNQMAVIK